MQTLRQSSSSHSPAELHEGGVTLNDVITHVCIYMILCGEMGKGKKTVFGEIVELRTR